MNVNNYCLASREWTEVINLSPFLFLCDWQAGRTHLELFTKPSFLIDSMSALVLALSEISTQYHFKIGLNLRKRYIGL